MKIRVLVSILCACLIIFVFTGCGMKMPNSSASPSDSADSSAGSSPGSSPTGGGSTNATTVYGIVSSFVDGTITIDLAAKSDTMPSDESSAFFVGTSVYVISGGVQSIDPDSGTAILYQNDGFALGISDDIVAGDFLAIILHGDTAVTIIDAGPAGASGTDDTEGEKPTAGPTDNEEPGDTAEPTDTQPSASPGVPDSGETKTYKVTTDSLKVRSGPGTDNSSLGTLDTGSRVTGTVTDGWLKFTYNGKTAYCKAEYLEQWTAPAGVPDSSESKTYKTTDNLQARSGPGTTYSSLGTIDKGTEVKGTVLGGWLKLTYNDKTAYCSAAYLTAG